MIRTCLSRPHMRALRSTVLVAVVALLSPSGATALPYWADVRIGPKTPDGVARPICPTDSIRVRVTGDFPTPCVRVAGVDLIPSPVASPLPQPPIVRITVEPRICPPICAAVLSPWAIEAMLPALPARDYGLIVQIVDRLCHGTTPTDSVLHQARVPFIVERCDSDPEPCVSDGWLHSGPGECDAHIAPGGQAQVTFTVQTPVALAGLEGVIHVHAPSDPRVIGPPLKIVNIEPVGPASGMQLAWTPDRNGTRFALFAEHGAPIPGSGVSGSGPAQPVLRITLAPSRDHLPAQTVVFAGELLGADEEGHGVPMCAFPTFAPVQAVICAGGSACDFNRDGRLDIRDLVLMVRCLEGTTMGEPGVACDSTRFHDCNADGARDLADVICCAREMLRPPCVACPRDTIPPGPAGVRAMLGEPRFAGDRATVPVQIDGWSVIGGAIIRMSYPDDRYEIDVETAPGTGVLHLSEARDGAASLGLIRLSGVPLGPEDAPRRAPHAVAELRLRLKPGRTHGGEIAFTSGEFSGVEGSPMASALGGSVPLGGLSAISLSNARPNPFSGETHIDLALERAAVVVVSVHDLAGRRVATLHRGPIAAGIQEFTWRGRRDDGSSAAAGIYFIRAVAENRVAERKLVRLP